MKVLFVHPNFPGQFKHLAKALASDPNNEVVFACRYDKRPNIEGVKRVKYHVTRTKSGTDSHRYLSSFDQQISCGQAFWRLAQKLIKAQFKPDVIYGHFGWGEGLFIKDLFPDVPVISYMEFYYHAFGADMHFAPHKKTHPDIVAQARIRNSTNLHNLVNCDWAISPTQWQASVHPQEFHHKFSVLHEGIDTYTIKPKTPQGKLHLPGGTTLDKNCEIITYVARNFEPYRGFPEALKALEITLKKRPNAHAIMVGGDEVSYGSPPPSGKHWRDYMSSRINIDPARIHWLGKLPYHEFLTILHHSNVHLYLTYPFVLSWSMLEAMAAGCAMVCSDTAPVREVMCHKKEGLLVDFFKPKDIASAIEQLLDNPKLNQSLRVNARTRVEQHFALEQLLPKHIELVKQFASNPQNPAIVKSLIKPKKGWFDKHRH